MQLGLLLGTRFRSAFVASASLLVATEVAPAQEHGAFERELARSLPDVSRWLSQSGVPATCLPAAPFVIKTPLVTAREESDAIIPQGGAKAGRDAKWLSVGLTPQIEGTDLSTSSETTSIALPFLPVTVGLSLDQFTDVTHEGDPHLLFADVGAMVSFPLALNPACFGRWTFSAGAHLRFFDSELRSANGGDATQWIGCAGFSLVF